MTADDIEFSIYDHVMRNENAIGMHIVSRIHLPHECDVISVTRQSANYYSYNNLGVLHDKPPAGNFGTVTEYEIKISKTDLWNDVKKGHFHNSPIIKYLYYAVPEELIEETKKLIGSQLGNAISRAGIMTPYIQYEHLSHGRLLYEYLRLKEIQKPIKNPNLKKLSLQDRILILERGAFKNRIYVQKIYELKKEIDRYRKLSNM